MATNKLDLSGNVLRHAVQGTLTEIRIGGFWLPHCSVGREMLHALVVEKRSDVLDARMDRIGPVRRPFHVDEIWDQPQHTARFDLRGMESLVRHIERRVE